MAGMVAGADSINDRTCSGAAAWVGCSAALRAFTFGHVCQLDAVDSQFLPRLSGQAPILAGRGADGVAGPRRQCHPDLWLREASRWPRLHRSQRAERVGRHRLHPLGGAGDRRNAATSGERPLVRGAATLVTEALQVARRCGACGPVILRTDSAFYTRAVVTAAHEAGARFSVTTPLYPSVTRAVAAIADTPIRSPLSPMRGRSAIRRGRKRFLRQPRAPRDQLRVPLTKFEVRCATHPMHRRN